MALWEVDKDKLEAKARSLGISRMCMSKGYLGDRGMCGHVMSIDKDICGYVGDGYCAKMLKTAPVQLELDFGDT